MMILSCEEGDFFWRFLLSPPNQHLYLRAPYTHDRLLSNAPHFARMCHRSLLHSFRNINFFTLSHPTPLWLTIPPHPYPLEFYNIPHHATTTIYTHITFNIHNNVILVQKRNQIIYSPHQAKTRNNTDTIVNITTHYHGIVLIQFLLKIKITIPSSPIYCEVKFLFSVWKQLLLYYLPPSTATQPYPTTAALIPPRLTPSVSSRPEAIPLLSTPPPPLWRWASETNPQHTILVARCDPSPLTSQCLCKSGTTRTSRKSHNSPQMMRSFTIGSVMMYVFFCSPFRYFFSIELFSLRFSGYKLKLVTRGAFTCQYHTVTSTPPWDLHRPSYWALTLPTLILTHHTSSSRTPRFFLPLQ